MTPIVFITKMLGGGMETFCLGLLNAWAKQGCRATLYSSYMGGVREVDIPKCVDRVCWNVRARNSPWKLAKWLRTRPNDPCLALSQELAVVLAFLKKSRLIKNRIYYRESTDVAGHYGKWFKRLMRWLWPCFDGIIEQSKVGVDATRLVCGGRLPRCLVVRNIMDKIDTMGTPEFYDGSKIKLVCVGSFKPMKGQRLLVAELSCETYQDWSLVFWGEGETRAVVERMVKEKGLGDNIKFNDWIDDRSRIYDKCDVVVVPSDYEGLPNVMLEAILYGKRVSVRPTCTGACELLQEIGIGETWPWRRALEVPADKWANARERLAEICDPKKVGSEILSFMGC